MNESKINIKLVAILAAAIAVLTAILVIIGYANYEPEIKYGEFPISITYELDGETVTLEDTIICEFKYGGNNFFSQYRAWDFTLGRSEYSDYVLFREDGEYLTLDTGLSAHYLMNDPLSVEIGKEFEELYDGLKYLEPFGTYGNADEFYETNDTAVLAEKGFKIVSYEYPEPIENKFSFVGIDFNNSTAIMLTLISAVTMIVFMFIIRRDKEYKYSSIDYVSICFNILITVLLLPLTVLLAMLWGIDGTSDALYYVIPVFCIPTLTIIGLGLSVLLRRRRMKIPGLVVQFVGPLMFGILCITDTLVKIF